MLRLSQNSLSSLVQAYPPKNKLYEFGRRIKFSIAKDDLDRRIIELNESTRNLERIRRYSNDLQVEYTGATISANSKTVSKITSYFDRVAYHARNLYSAISLGYMEQCCSNHEAQLFLQHRASVMEKPHLASKAPLSFSVSFGPATWGHRYKMDIMVLEDKTPSSFCTDR